MKPKSNCPADVPTAFGRTSVETEGACHFTGGALSVLQDHVGFTYGWTEYFFATNTLPLPGLLCFQFWRVNSLKTSALREMFCAFSKPHPRSGYVVTEDRQSCIMQARKKETAAERGCWMLEPHLMDLDPTWASLTFCAGFCSALHSQKVSTATATSHHIACTSEIHNTSEVNFAQRPVMLTFVHLRAVARSPWYQGQSWNCFLGILHNVYFSSFCPFSAFSDADLQLQGKESALWPCHNSMAKAQRGLILCHPQAAEMYLGEDWETMFMVANLSEPHEFFTRKKGEDLFLFGEQGAQTSPQQAHQEGMCKGLCGHLFLLCTGAPVPAASAAQPSHVRAPLPGPVLPSVCSSLIPHHRMSLLSTNPIYLP